LLAITFDDGQRDNYEHARPVLRDAGVRASFFPSTDHVETGKPIWHDRLGGSILRILQRDAAGGAKALRTAGIEVPPAGDIHDAILHAAEHAKTLAPSDRAEHIVRIESLANHTSREPEPWEGIMSWDELAELAEEGHEIGSHSRTHALLPQCQDTELAAEITGSRQRLRQELGIDCDCFCYPNGDNDPRTVRAVADAGYRYAITTAWGSNAPGANPLTLKRCNMNAAQVVDRFGRPSPARLAWRLSGLHPGLS
jgi:peptidoglycan/xylan/chitin deacetylase (PgdA/CDA1 family)